MVGQTGQTIGLYGLKHSNRDFTKQESWGKNQFNSSFPAALACYMDFIEMEPVYITLESDKTVLHNNISVQELFGTHPNSPNLFFAFERDFSPYQPLVTGTLTGIDLVTMDMKDNSCLRGIEIKLTALPDHVTSELPDNKYGCEIVVRPPTIIYLGLSLATIFNDNKEGLMKYLEVCNNISDWTSISKVRPHLNNICDSLDGILIDHLANQQPLVMQPIWKTKGKSAELHDNCLDIFVWSNFAFTRLFMDITRENISNNYEGITRHMRTVVWIIKMLYDFAMNEKVDCSSIIDQLSFNTKNDKAFAVSGAVSHRYMKSPELENPRITKNEIKYIILGGGQEYLSPERRFDAVIKNTPGLFDF